MYNRNTAQPYIWRWNFNVQRELGHDMVLEVGYMGSRGSKLTEDDRNLNDTQLQYLSTSPVRDQAAIDRLARVVNNPFAGLLPGTSMNGATTSASSLLRAYPQFSGVTVRGFNTGRSWFQMFQTRLDKRFSHGFNFLANFQWQKMIEETNRLNAYDTKLEHRIATEDRPLRLVLSGTYELPFGKGKRFLGNGNGFTNRLFGGWQANAIWVAQSGAPASTWGNIIYFGGPLNWNPREIDGLAFDVNQFERAAARQLGSNVRTFNTRFSNLRADGVNNLDLSLIKNVQLVERLNLQLRAEMFNSLNRTQFNGPDLGPTNGNFGRITSAANLPRALQLAARFRW